MTKFRNNIPSLRGIINYTSVTFLWRFRNGWMAPIKQEDERKPTETECNKTPWGQHAHQLIQHMEKTATSDAHVSQCDQRNNALKSQNESRTCPPCCGWNPTAHSFSCAVANYEFKTFMIHDFHHSDLHIWLPILDRTRIWLPASFLHHWDVCTPSAGHLRFCRSKSHQKNPFMLYFWRSVWLPWWINGRSCVFTTCVS